MDVQTETPSPVSVVRSLSKSRVLLAEDDAELRTLFGLCLRGAGYDVVDASDGTEAL